MLAQDNAVTVVDMMPDEIRLVISNPETLYGEEGVPSR